MYEEITYETLLGRMLERAGSIDGNVDTREGSLVWLGSAPVAMELQNLYLALDNLFAETFADTASREYLIRRAGERGIVPYSATPAVLRLEVVPTSLSLSMNTRFSIGALNYAVTDDLGSGAYELTCETAGQEGNQYSGPVVPIDFIEGLESCSVTALLVPGEDEEDTEALRQRYFDSLNAQAFGGNHIDYIEKTKALPGVGGVKVYRAWNGDVAPASLAPPEEAAVWMQSLSGVPETVKTWLEAVYAAGSAGKLTVGGMVKLVLIDSTFSQPSATLISQVQTAIDPEQNAGEGLGIAPIGHVVKVHGVEAETVDLSFSLYYQRGWSWDDVKGYVTDAVNAYFLELAKSWADQEEALIVRISQVESRLLDIDGILDIAGTKLNGAATNYALALDHIPVLGEITASTITISA